MMRNAVIHDIVNFKVLIRVRQCHHRVHFYMSAWDRLFAFMLVIQVEVMQHGASCGALVIQS